MNNGVKSTGQVFDIPAHKIRPMPNQPRGRVTEEDVAAKVASMREKGQTDPGKVYRLKKKDGDVEFELIAGETRWRACLVLKTSFRTTIEEGNTELDRYELAVISNSYNDMSHMAWARALDRIKRERGCTSSEVATRVSKKLPFVVKHLKLMLLHPDIMEMVDRKIDGISFDNAVKLADLPQSRQLEEVKRLRESNASNGTNGHRLTNKQAGFFIEKSRVQLRAALGSPNQPPKSEFAELAKEMQNIVARLSSLAMNSEATLGAIMDECKGDDVSLRKLVDRANFIVQHAATFSNKIDSVLKSKGKGQLLKLKAR